MKENIEQLINKFWEGTATLDERIALHDMLDGDHAELKEKLIASFSNNSDQKNPLLIDPAIQSNLLNKIHEKAGITSSPTEVQKKRWTVGRLSIAASLVAALLTIAWLVWPKTDQKPQLTAQMARHIETVRLTNEGASAKQLTLPDHSVVTLEPGSYISYTDAFGKSERLIDLEGTAKFSVAHDKKRPFIVRANGYSTTALGTEFIVNGKDKKTVVVELLTGKVVVRSLRSSTMKDVYLKPGEELTINGSAAVLVNKLIAKRPVPVPETPANKNTTEKNVVSLSFKVIPLKDVFDKIGKLRDVVIITQDADLSNKVFTGEFLPDESLDTILSIICGTNNLNYKIEPGKVTITNKDNGSER